MSARVPTTRPRRILLINPRMCSRQSMRLPLSLLALGAVLDGQFEYEIVDGNRVADLTRVVLGLLSQHPHAVAAVSVMPGPQVGPAIEASRAIRAQAPQVPIVWGGYFPSLYSAAALNAPYVDFVVRGPGEDTLLELLRTLPECWPDPTLHDDSSPLGLVKGLSWKDRRHGVRHNPNRPLVEPDQRPALPYHRLDGLAEYLRPTFLGSRTAVHQAAIGCRYRCGFCGVVSVFNGETHLDAPQRLEQALTTIRGGLGANAVQFYDHNFFDRESSALPALEVLARAQLPWWCYARADTLAHFSAATWALVRRSQLRMAYIGAESGSEAVLRAMKKGTKVEHTLEVAAKCREAGIVPEFSFVLGGPDDPEDEVERTLAFIRQVKLFHPSCEIVLYFYSPTPQRDRAFADRDVELLPHLATYGPDGPSLPTTPEEWAQPQWVRYVCHQDAPWLTPRLRRRIRDFAQVVGCRFPTVQDARTPEWGKTVLKGLAAWRYASGIYARPYELDLARRLIPLKRPEVEGL